MNKLYLGDNLKIMKKIPDESVDLVATDPPFNTNRNWDEFNDKWCNMTAFIEFMQERCDEIYRLLNQNGSLYLHCDTHASHYLKVMLDSIFGIQNFRNEIVWHYQPGTAPKNAFGRKHDLILFYSKGKSNKFHRQSKPSLAPWDYKSVDEVGRRYRINSQGVKYFLDEGQTCDDVWTYVHEREFNTLVSTSSERLEYPTQKPIALYNRIINASSNIGDIVLDPFCGSGTTLVAAQTLGRQWIGIDKNPSAIDLCENRLHPPQGSFL